MLVSVSMIGVLLHILMDLPTSYGTRLLSPFDWHWYALDWLPIVDIYLLVILATSLVLGYVSPESRRRLTVLALVLMAGDYGLRATAHRQALAVAPRLFGPLLPSRCDGGRGEAADARRVAARARPPAAGAAAGRASSRSRRCRRSCRRFAGASSRTCRTRTSCTTWTCSTRG